MTHFYPLNENFLNLMPATGRVSQKQALESVKECVKRLWNTLKNNVPQHQIAKALQISSSTVHGEISVRKGQG